MPNPWWIEEVGDTPPPTKRLEASEAKKMLFQVLAHYGSDLSPSLVTNSTSGEGRWIPIRCPFHEDRHASASVNFRLNRFKCHACDAHGDAIDLVMREECLTFKDALTWIDALFMRWINSGEQITYSTSIGSEGEVLLIRQSW